MSEANLTFIAAIVCSVIGAGAFFHYFLATLRWPKTTGKVTGNHAELRSTGGFDYAHFPIIEFRAEDGTTYRVRGDVGQSQEWPIGKSITLRYRASNPQHSTAAKGWQRLLFSLVFIGFAGLSWYAWVLM